MRNKKYRPWKLILVLWAVAIPAFIASFFVHTTLEKAFIITCGVILFIGSILLLPLYLEIKDDRIVTRIGIESLSKAHRNSLKKRVIMFDDLFDIYVENEKNVVVIFKDGIGASFTIRAFLNKDEIIELIYDVKDQIKQRESHK